MKKDVNIAVLSDKLLNAVGKFGDYRTYALELCSIDGRYDETFEIYNLDVWMDDSQGMIQEQAGSMLKATLRLFNNLETSAMKELYHVMKEIVDCSQEDQRNILGFSFENCDFNFDRFSDMILECYDWPYDQNGCLEFFLNLLKKEFKIKHLSV